MSSKVQKTFVSNQKIKKSFCQTESNSQKYNKNKTSNVFNYGPSNAIPNKKQTSFIKTVDNRDLGRVKKSISPNYRERQNYLQKTNIEEPRKAI